MNNNYIVFVLCKDFSNKSNEYIKTLLQKNIPHRIICDLCSIDNDQKLLSTGFFNLTRSLYIKKPSAWDKSFYTIIEDGLLKKYDYFYFIEDDVYSKNYSSLVSFILDAESNHTVDLITKKIKPQSDHPKWRYWKEDYIKNLSNPHQSFNPLCRLSNRLINKILDYKNTHNKFNFHEILFASLCLENNLSYVNYIDDPILKKYIGKFSYAPILTMENINDDLIYHPVKESKQDREKNLMSTLDPSRYSDIMSQTEKP
jgi:hypothetical protein